MNICYDSPKVEEYINLRLASGMGSKKYSNSEKALKNSVFTVSIREKEELIAFGRIVSDGGITYVVSDIMVHKDFQNRGFGKIIMEEINNYLEKYNDEDSYTILIANKPADKLYSKYSFEYTEPFACGMKRKNKSI